MPAEIASVGETWRSAPLFPPSKSHVSRRLDRGSRPSEAAFSALQRLTTTRTASLPGESKYTWLVSTGPTAGDDVQFVIRAAATVGALRAACGSRSA
jgi:hypothetical protein